MDNNDIFRKLRFIFDYSDSDMIALFAEADLVVTRSQVSDWLKKEDDPAFRKLDDLHLAVFLNGLINRTRGKKEGVEVVPEKQLNNNIILRKLKIALNYRDEDMLEVLALADLQISKHELSAFFRNPNQSQYRPCHDQVMRNFLLGLQFKMRKNKG